MTTNSIEDTDSLRPACGIRTGLITIKTELPVVNWFYTNQQQALSKYYREYSLT